MTRSFAGSRCLIRPLYWLAGFSAVLATPDIGKRLVRDRKTSEILDPELVRQGRELEQLNMEKMCL